MRSYCQWCMRSGPMLLSHETSAGTVLLHASCRHEYLKEAEEVARSKYKAVPGEENDK